MAASMQLDRAPWTVPAAALVQAVVLLATANGYGYHRDELYFRMLPPAWGYLDQPPLTPLLAGLMSGIHDSVWVLRLPAVLAATVCVLVVAALAREVGGSARAQTLAAWGFAFATFSLMFGHTLLTNTLDALVWLAIVLCAVRGCLRQQPRWWLLAGLVTGVGLYNKFLVVILLAALLAGLLLAGPRRVLISRGVLGGLGIALVVGSPNLLYQAVHGWPQLTFGRALSAENSSDARGAMWPLLLVMLGPPLVIVWLVGLVALVRRPQWRPIRFLAPAFVVLLGLCWLLGTQPTYPYALLAALYAIGCVPVSEWCRTRVRLGVVVGLVALNSLLSAVSALPLIPVTVIGQTPVPAMNQVVRDSIGWPTYVRQIADTAHALGDRPVVITTNYGEAGAVARFDPSLLVYSGHNELWYQGRPAAGVQDVVLVGDQYESAAALFERCEIRGRLDNGVGVDNEEQDAAVAVCSGPVGGWDAVWPRLQHFG